MSLTSKAPNPEKGRKYYASLDQALCNGNWTEVPELARKTDKHAPERGCFTLTARTEAQIASASHRPTSASSSETASIHSLSEALPKLKEAVHSRNVDPEDVYCASTCIAEIYWLQDDAAAAVAALPKENVHSRPTGNHAAPLGWLEVCAAKASFIRAAALEANGSGQDIQDVYRAAATHAPGSRSPELRRWTERLLARACMYNFNRALTPTLYELNDALISFRAWSSFWQRSPPPASGSGISPTRVDIPRREVWKAYYDTLSVILRHELIYNPRTDQNAELLVVPTEGVYQQQYVDAKSRQRAELKRVEATYESLLLNETQFPKASQSNAEVERWVEEAVGNWRVLCGPEWSDEELGEGGKPALGKGLLDILYRAATKTFHSTAILRQLFTVHAAIGEFELALHAFKSYTEIISKGKARAEKTGKHELGFDSDDLAIVTAAEAIKICCKYGDREEAERARDVGKDVQKWLQQQRPGSVDEIQASDDNKAAAAAPPPHPTESQLQPKTLAIAYSAIGVSQAHWARFTYETDARSGLQTDALANLTKSLTYDQPDAETAFALAKLQAEMQNVEGAVAVVKRAIAMGQVSGDDNGDGKVAAVSQRAELVPLWHLLALCLTAGEDYEAAAQMCEAAFDQLGNTHMLYGSDHTRSLQQRGLVDAMDSFQKDALLQVKISQLTLVELMEGPEKAVESSEELLRLYVRLFGSSAQLTAPTKSLSVTASAVVPPSRSNGGGTLRSMAGSIRPKSARTSAEKETPSHPAAASSGIDGHGQGSPIAITVTNENGASEEKRHHHQHHDHHLHLPFKSRGHNGDTPQAASLRAKRSIETSDEKSGLGLDGVDKALPVPPSGTNITDYAHSAANPPVINNAVNNSVSPDAPTGPQQPLKEAAHNAPHDQWPAPPGHNDQPLEQDVRLPAPYPASSSGQSPTVSSSVSSSHERQHKVSILVNVWLFVSGLYIRAGFFEDAEAAIQEARKFVEALEAEKGSQHANARELFVKGWGGGKSVDALWADVWCAKGALASARELPYEAMSNYEQTLSFYPDHPAGIIGISNLSMDIYEEKIPAEEPKPLLEPITTGSGTHIHDLVALSSSPSRPTTAKSSLADAGRTTPPSARTRDPTPAMLNRLAARDRAYMLLSNLTRLGTGWDSSEAWYTLARAYELSKQIDKAKQALWWVVELEDSRPMRHWSEVTPGGYVL
ncbi:hypothetical protein BAUCODRAFT_33430 [Baudoinia panamericana UAMH 10762]|uniref:Filamentation protein n=1 Tax=Baudoinia panamericana (strain UAMH 10762) TaxID=717646 RepID=M2NEN4_BAUPA|nr:uncharacterized protein BAUCODRAFT_33430 [Baudoinia panamericana UAMH 10762]EMC97709.1 hypothetical protein BAUCODRAFT_33430 [Baudoinia panamericana UAMH 10762]